MSNTFTCSMCGEVYEKDWSDEEAEQESIETFGHIPEEEREVVCDDCYKALMAK